jgi:hypothetical protein
MARTITIDDDRSAVVVALTIADGESDIGPRVTSLHIDARNGGALVADDLRVLEQFGLRLPAPAAARRKAPPRPPRDVPAVTEPTKRGRRNPVRDWYDAQPAAWRASHPLGGDGRYIPRAIMDAHRAAIGLPVHPAHQPHQRPSDAELRAAVAEVGLSQVRLAERFDVPVYVTERWVNQLREAGLTDGK